MPSFPESRRSKATRTASRESWRPIPSPMTPIICRSKGGGIQTHRSSPLSVSSEAVQLAINWIEAQSEPHTCVDMAGGWLYTVWLPLVYIQGHRFADDTFKSIFLNENFRISIKISLKFVPKGPINNNPALVQIMAWRLLGDKPISEPMMA